MNGQVRMTLDWFNNKTDVGVEENIYLNNCTKIKSLIESLKDIMDMGPTKKT